MECFVFLRFAFDWSGISRLTVIVPALLFLIGCTQQQPAWERYRAAPSGEAVQSRPAANPDAAAATVTPPPANVAAEAPAEPAPLPATAVDVTFPDPEELRPYLVGVASWYGPGFQGRRTANGEIYNQYGLTAAHPMLPMGTKIEVENRENGRKVWLRINDRGPYKKGRVLDLSRLAAERLGIVKEGTARVRIRVLRWPETIQPELGLKAYKQFVVQVAAHPDPLEAEGRRREVQRRVPWARFRIDRPPGGAYTVVTGLFDDPQAARAEAARLQREGLTVLVRSYRK